MPTDLRAIPGLFEAQRAFFRDGRRYEMASRLAGLRRLSSRLQERTDEALAALAEDLGKPALEAWLAEIHFVRDEIALICRQLPRWARPRRARSPFYFLPARSEVRREAYGTVLVAAPWNYPLQLALSPLLAAVAAGNSVILKPSECAPATSRFLASLLGEVFDPEQVAVVEGGAGAGAALLELPFDFFFYTGGEKIGRRYAEAAARHLAPAALELGGKCPCVVDHDVVLDRVVERVVASKFFNAGQTCVAPDFVVVPSALHDEFVSCTRERLLASYGNTPSPDLARIINTHHYQRLRSLLTPATICVGEDRPHDRYLAPRLLPHADWETPAMQEEIFGPVLPIVPYEDLDSCLAVLRSRPTPLALYAFSRRAATLEHIAGAVPSGSVCFNDAMKPATNPHLPLGGVGPSGMGRYHGEAGFHQFTYPRSVVRRWLLPDPFLVMPPYGDRLRKLRRFLER